MNKLWCKIVVIIAIVVAGLIVLSICVWVIRAVCCGVKTVLCCCCCCGRPNQNNAPMNRDIENQAYQQPPNMYYQPNGR